MNRKTVINSLITLITVVGSASIIRWVLLSNNKKNDEKTAIVAQVESSVSVRGSVVSKKPLTQDLLVNGSFIPTRQLDFPAENSGRVLRVLVAEGSRVRAGQTLAIIKGEQLNIDKESAQMAFELAGRDLQRYENAFKTGGVTQQQLDQARLAVSNAHARLKDAAIRVGDTHVRSSINGIVNKRLIEPGSVVSPGTVLFELVDVSRLRLQVMVTEDQIARIRSGQQATIAVSALPEKQFSGKVIFIASKAGNTLGFPVELELVNDPKHLVKAGMYGTARFEFSSASTVILIPRSSFVGSVSSNEVFVIREDSTVSLQKVVAGRITGDQVEVLEGLKDGQTVVTSGQINLDEGSKVRLVH